MTEDRLGQRGLKVRPVRTVRLVQRVQKVLLDRWDPQAHRVNQALLRPIGAVGPRGEQGPIGEAGPEGPMGPRGPDGQAGQDGERGPVEEQGPRGEAGPDGLPGADGLEGPRGQQAYLVNRDHWENGVCRVCQESQAPWANKARVVPLAPLVHKGTRV